VPSPGVPRPPEETAEQAVDFGGQRAGFKMQDADFDRQYAVFIRQMVDWGYVYCKVKDGQPWCWELSKV